MTDSAFTDLGREKYVQLTTFRRDGRAVPTAVWLVPDGGNLLVTTMSASGKAKRLGHTPRVLLVPCDARGRVRPGAAQVEASATVVSDPAESDRLQGLIKARYGLFAKVLLTVEKLRRSAGERVEIRISPKP